MFVFLRSLAIIAPQKTNRARSILPEYVKHLRIDTINLLPIEEEKNTYKLHANTNKIYGD